MLAFRVPGSQPSSFKTFLCACSFLLVAGTIAADGLLSDCLAQVAQQSAFMRVALMRCDDVYCEGLGNAVARKIELAGSPTPFAQTLKLTTRLESDVMRVCHIAHSFVLSPVSRLSSLT